MLTWHLVTHLKKLMNGSNSEEVDGLWKDALNIYAEPA